MSARAEVVLCGRTGCSLLSAPIRAAEWRPGSTEPRNRLPRACPTRSAFCPLLGAEPALGPLSRAERCVFLSFLIYFLKIKIHISPTPPRLAAWERVSQISQAAVRFLLGN